MLEVETECLNCRREVSVEGRRRSYYHGSMGREPVVEPVEGARCPRCLHPHDEEQPSLAVEAMAFVRPQTRSMPAAFPVDSTLLKACLTNPNQQLETETLTVSTNVHLVHTTKAGEQLFIAQLEDEHLMNCIGMICKRISEARERLEGVGVSRAKQALYGLDPEKSYKQAQLSLQKSVAHVMPYVFEAQVRGISASQLLQDAVGRTARDEELPAPMPGTALLPAPEDRFDDDEDDSAPF